MVPDPIPQSLPVHFFGSRPQPPTSRLGRMCCRLLQHTWSGLMRLLWYSLTDIDRLTDIRFWRVCCRLLHTFDLVSCICFDIDSQIFDFGAFVAGCCVSIWSGSIHSMRSWRTHIRFGRICCRRLHIFDLVEYIKCNLTRSYSIWYWLTHLRFVIDSLVLDLGAFAAGACTLLISLNTSDGIWLTHIRFDIDSPIFDLILTHSY